jgi:hypothetical protein
MTQPLPLASTGSQKWALLVGVNEYPRLDKRYHLSGCVNDVSAIEELLTGPQFGFPPEHVLKLTSPASGGSSLPTRANILEAFREHLTENPRIRPGDVVVIYYSGHGSQIPDEEGDEEDGFDETIVPCDAGPDRSKREDVLDISDDEISLMLEHLAERTRNINLIFDSCHSGTVTRDLADAPGQERHLPAATYPVEARPRAAAATTRSMGPSGWMPLSDGYVLLSACMADERAREDGFGFWRKKRFGLLTYYLLETMREVGTETTYYDIWDRLKVKVSSHNRWQNPQIEGAYERKVFGGAALPRRRFVEVSGKDDRGVTLAAGVANGATLNSRFAVYPRDTQVFDDRSARVAIVRLTGVDAFTSVGRIEEGLLEAVEQGLPAVEIEHDYGDMRMGVFVRGDDPLVERVRELIAASSLLKSAELDDNSPAAVVKLGSPEDTPGAAEAYLILNAGDGLPLVEPVTAGDNAPTLVIEKLEKVASYYNVLGIHNPDAASALKNKVKLRLLKVSGQDEHERELVTPVERNAGGEIILKVDDRVYLEAENLSDFPLYVSAIDFDTSWGVCPIFPEPGAADATVRPHASRRLKRFRVNLPEYQKPVKEGDPPRREVIKLIATTAPVDFRPLWQEGTRDLEGGSLYGLMKRAVGRVGGTATRSLEPEDDPVVRDWTTSEIVFYITT